jgi:CxxC motif-containing protein (DUF1111 family)
VILTYHGHLYKTILVSGRKAVKKLLLSLLSLTMAVLPVSAASPGTPKVKTVIPQEVYKQPVPGMSAKDKQRFIKGERVFTNFWIAVNNPVIPLIWDLSQSGPGGGEWGLGPMFMATNCAGCHLNAGRGRALDASGLRVFQQLVRLSIPGETPHGGPKPDPNYGQDIQSFDMVTRSDPDARAGEGEVFIDWVNSNFTFPDGSTIELRKPSVRVENLNFGPLADNVMISLRNTQAILGMGYLEAISEKDILKQVEKQKAMGLNGRPNYVRDDINKKISLGRFGWKANQPSIKQQVASAFLADIGINSAIYPEQSCTPVQKECLAAISGKEPELRDELWEPITFWSQSLDVPAQRNRETAEFKTGEKLFESAGCSGCHVPEMRTGKYAAVPQLSNKLIRPYTDLLLHDMGPDLADGRSDFKASGSDWRTPPLWGIGLSMQVNASNSFLHDGRARNLLEAIVWHGGEAKTSRDKFIAFTKKQRDELIYFLSSI